MNKGLAAVVLCAGQGTRMNDDRTHKVCYEVSGVPVIVRLIRNMQRAGIRRFVVVVGYRAEKVMECLSGIDGIVYAYQPVQNGTGGAALCGLNALKTMGYEGSAVIAMGDKITAPDVFESLIDKRRETGSKAVFAVQSRENNENGGRIVIQNGRVYGVVEKADSGLLALGALRERTEENFGLVLDRMGLNEKKKQKVIRRALERTGALPDTVRLCGRDFTAEEIEQSIYTNAGLYFFDVELALFALRSAKSDNVQQELYLTDTIEAIAARGGAELIVVTEKTEMLTYSTMDELLALCRYFESPKTKRTFTPASVWAEKIKNDSDEVKKIFEDIYGAENEAYIRERRETYLHAIEKFIEKYGDKEVVITRAPGRVNLLGRHIDHRGGSINVMSINRETVVIASPREDDTVNISNVDGAFRDFSFSILQTIKCCDHGDWLDFIENDSVLKLVDDSRGEWVNYIKAGVLRLQMNNKAHLLSGMDMMFSGNIPMAAGLSSSSSLVVATSEAVIAINDLDIKVKEFIHLCGEGEWFVGSRGGSGDHAAMKCGKRNMITHLSFCPFEIKESVEFSADYRIVVANSYIEAKKSAGAKDLFNQRVASSEFGFLMIKKNFPEYQSKLTYFRDVNARNLGVTQSRIYQMLLSLPERVTGEELRQMLPEYREKIDRIQKNHKIPAYYEIRSVVLFGLAECLRAEKCMTALKKKDYAMLGNLMNVSHDGDRVYKDGKEYDYSASSEYLRERIRFLVSQEEDMVAAAQLYNQPGGYACSTKEIDELVDFIIKQKGVLGAELSGAGLGGCIIILVRKNNTFDLLEALKSHYYDKNGLPMGAQVFIPAAGSSALT